MVLEHVECQRGQETDLVPTSQTSLHPNHAQIEVGVDFVWPQVVSSFLRLLVRMLGGTLLVPLSTSLAF